MKKALDPKTHRTASDAMRKEYRFDYRRAKSNRFAPEDDRRWACRGPRTRCCCRVPIFGRSEYAFAIRHFRNALTAVVQSGAH